MKLISRFEAATRSTTELHWLHTQALYAFAKAARGSHRGSALTGVTSADSTVGGALCFSVMAAASTVLPISGVANAKSRPRAAVG
jgi:hypothetical protein